MDIVKPKSKSPQFSLHEIYMNRYKQNLFHHMNSSVLVKKNIKSGMTIYHNGSKFHALYGLQRGFIKTEFLHEDGRKQITGFYMPGDVFGFDGISTDHHVCSSIALEDSEIYIVPLIRLEGLNQFTEEFILQFTN